MLNDPVYRVFITTVRPPWWMFWKKTRREWTVTCDEMPVDGVYKIDIIRYANRQDEMKINEQIVPRGLVYFDGTLTATIGFREWLTNEIYKPQGDNEQAYMVLKYGSEGHGLMYHDWANYQSDHSLPVSRKHPW